MRFYIFTCLLIAFSYNIFAMLDPRLPREHWTSCSEFLNHTKFDSEKIIGIDWMIFFFWNPELERTYNVKFSRPSEMLVDRFKVEIEREMRDKINWADAELFMETSVDFSALFFKTNVSGVYRVIPSKVFDMISEIPTLFFAMKLIEPAKILGIENCQFRICYALAPVDKMPHHSELEKAAKSLGFFGDFNRSHIDILGPAPGLPSPDPVEAALEGDEMKPEDEDLDIEQNLDSLQFF